MFRISTLTCRPLLLPTANPVWDSLCPRLALCGPSQQERRCRDCSRESERCAQIQTRTTPAPSGILPILLCPPTVSELLPHSRRFPQGIPGALLPPVVPEGGLGATIEETEGDRAPPSAPPSRRPLWSRTRKRRRGRAMAGTALKRLMAEYKREWRFLGPWRCPPAGGIAPKARESPRAGRGCDGRGAGQAAGLPLGSPCSAGRCLTPSPPPAGCRVLSASLQSSLGRD